MGEGPFPSEDKGDPAIQLRKRGNEYGAVTGRPRRSGWVDLPLLRYSGMINGTSWLVVTKLDVLDELAEIPVCVGYKIDGKTTSEVPAQTSGYDKIECIYQNDAGMADFHRGHHAITRNCRRPRATTWRSGEGSGGEGRHGLHWTGPKPDDPRG